LKSRLFTTAAFAAVAIAPSVMCASPALAQSSQLQEIIVTARKRQESILNVPVVETAIGQQQLERLQTKDLRDIATLVPGLALGESVLSNGVQLSIRGVGTTSYDPGVDQSVSMNVDGLQLSNGLAYMSGLFDAGQIEVLKGPQALFYGKSNPGGVISVRTADPTSELEVIARAGYEFEAREKRGELIVSGPVSDTVKARLAGFYSTSDGFYKNVQRNPVAALGAVAAPKRIGGDERYQMRATVLWNPTDQFDARLKLNQARDQIREAGALQLVQCPEGTGPLVLGPGIAFPFLNPADNCRKDRKISWVDMNPAAFPAQPTDGTGYQDMTQTYGTLELNYRPSHSLTLTSVSAAYLLHSKSAFQASAASAAPSPIAVTNGFRRRVVTQEFRANSDFEGPLNFTAGAYVERGRVSDLVTLYGDVRVGFPALLQKGNSVIHVKTNSLFGQLRYQITPELELSGGARWTDETRRLTPTDFTTGVPIAISKPRPKLHSKNVSPELTLTYKPSDDMTIFANAKRGYKSGSYSIGTPPVAGVDNSFGDERVTGGEVGFKTRAMDRALLLNVAAYYYKYKACRSARSSRSRTASR
jgi:outer membrane receptor protein involved in Fe transport